MRKILIFTALLFPFIINAQTDIPAAELTTDQKIAIYAQIKKDPTIPVIINATLGFGIGSFSQRDIQGGRIGLIMDPVTIIISGIGIATYSGRPQDQGISSALMIVGIAGFLGSRIYQIIRPVSYSQNMNKQILKYLKFQEPAVLLSISMAGEKKGFSVQERF